MLALSVHAALAAIVPASSLLTTPEETRPCECDALTLFRAPRAAVPPAELQRFRGIRHAFDPDGLLDPGKAVPALARCAELGRRHVHHGQLAHHELPRC